MSARVKPKVLITRAASQIDPLRRLLSAHGFEPIELPVIAIEPYETPQQLQRIHTQLQSVEKYDKIIAISSNAVRFAIQHLQHLHKWEALQRTALFGVGKATAEAFQKAGYAALCPIDGSDSEALLAMHELQSLSGQKVLLLCGEGGRDQIEKTVMQRGGQIDRCELYRRAPVSELSAQLQQLDLQGRPDILTALSGFTVEQIGLAIPPSAARKWLNLPLVVPSGRVAEIAKKWGFCKVFPIPETTLLGILEGVQSAARDPDFATKTL